ncbi:peptidase S8/S53 domain-containing protein [Ilyonectria sp. MPI-CAGE-AT-0026]|nr:peptidase S8/S53 domain-containing protein [Ilyonectria sp. MPI-CAGE-AT-0026]
MLIITSQAIYHAIETLDVDIISMSFAFEEEELAIKDALYNAKKKSLKPVLMFAAASNNRALQNQPIGYPARVNDRVICVNSSTIQDEKSSFSPHGIPGWPNLSAVGENVLAAWPTSKSGPWKRMSGTSCATPIVAGVAALILDFAKKDIPELRNQHGWNARKAELWETLGMRSVLRRCLTDEYKDEKYNFLRPWKLLTEPEHTIAVRIEEALKFKHHWG